MYDQATKLRAMAERFKKKIDIEIKNNCFNRTKVLVISSGKGGVGKTTLAVNIAFCLAKNHKKVLLMDADMGMANIDIMLAIAPKYNLYHLVNKINTINEIIFNGPHNIDIIPGGSGIAELANLSEEQLTYILQEMSKIDGIYDYMIVDTGAGISKQVIRFLLAADEVIILATPEPTSFADAYGLLKSIHNYGYQGKVNLIMNQVKDEIEGILLAEKFILVSKKFLKREVSFLGHIEKESFMAEHICHQELLVQVCPHNKTAQNIKNVAKKIINSESDIDDGLFNSTQDAKGGIKGFFSKILNFKLF